MDRKVRLQVRDVKAEYVTYLQKKEKYAASTVNQHRLTVERFDNHIRQTFALPRLYIQDISEEYCEAYLDDLYNGRGDGVYDHELARLKVFLRWCMDEDWYEGPHPMRRIKRKNTHKRVHTRTYVHLEELPIVAQAGAVWHLRDKYYILFTWHSGKRVGEVVPLKWKDFDLDGTPLYPNGCYRHPEFKTRGGEIVTEPLDSVNVGYLHEWKKIYSDDLGVSYAEMGEMFVFPALRRVGRSRIRYYDASLLNPYAIMSRPSQPISDALRRAGMKVDANGDEIKHKAGHALRRGVATFYRKKVGIRAAKTLLGHTVEGTTELYTDQSEDQQELVGHQETLFGQPVQKPTKPQVSRGGLTLIRSADTA